MMSDDLSVRYLIKVETKIFITQPCHTSKYAKFYVDFKNINLPL
jgi:predicted nucleic-acid-binding Zn-ribbon protein